MRLLHSNTSTIIVDPDVILIKCPQYEKALTTFQFSNSLSLKMGLKLKHVAEHEL